MIDLLSLALQFVILFPAIVLHEVAHGYAAFLLGDQTAKRAGRLTLNPFAHVDLWGTILMPLLLLLLSRGTFFFGYAKPVPFNPYNFKDRPLGTLITGVAGPITNIVLAIVAGLATRLFPVPVALNLAQAWGEGPLTVVASVLFIFAWSNLVLAFFNLVPIPPLDGSRVFQYFLPEAGRRAYFRIEPYGFMIIIGMTWIVPGMLTGYLGLTAVPVFELITGRIIQGF
ncbi:MAG: site-2 protease family protein [Coriobacteriales bacterium]|nr:site-2 protease family protein [Coriobacteriales bacterium]